ncbi:Actin-like protein arp9 (SWI/SNF complex component arp9), partial [Ascosphaera acerosa]
QDQEPADGDDVGMTDAPDASDVKQEDSQPAEPAPDKSTSTATAATTQEPASQPATSSPLSPPPDTSPPTPEYMEVEETQAVWQEDPTSEDGAVYPLRAGAIVDWPCFFALLTHIYNTLSPPFHTPVIMIAQPCWSLRDRELITQFVFEKFKVPAFCLVDAALAVCYAYGVTTATVVDVGYAKADVTAVVDSLVCEYGRGVALRGCGGDAATQRLHELLRSKGFSREMCEQLKRSNIAEVLATDIPMPGTDTAVRGRAAGASSGNGDGVPAPSVGEIIAGGQQTLPTQQGQSAADEDDDDGVLDVAAIVTGNTSEILAQKEREKAERLAAKKGGAGAAALDAAAKAARLPNAKKETNSFVFSEYVPVRDDNGVGEHYVLRTQEVEVGQERFRALTPADDLSGPDAPMFGVLEAIAAQVHHTIMSVPDVSRRAELWDSIVIVGGGSKLRGESSPPLD